MDETNGGGGKKKPKPGILRLDIKKPRSSSRGSVEFNNETDILGEGSSSPPSQLSVKWAFPFDVDYIEKDGPSYESLEKTYLGIDKLDKRRRKTGPDYFNFQSFGDAYYTEPLDVPGYSNSEDDDYSVSVFGVMQRRASVRGSRKHKNRSASPMMGHVSGNTIAVGKGDRRRSSVYTTSSGETAISMGDGTHNQDSTKEQIFENIRLHKEVLQSVKLQPWSMRRKLRLVRQAKEYIARHEGALQERFAMSRSTKDLWARFKIVLAVKWTHFRRELINISTVFIPWQLRIKEIESHFGSVVASYFTFLRWLFWVNIVIAVILTIFVVTPEFLASQWPPKFHDHRKELHQIEQKNATSLITIWDFEGYLKYSPLFYGYYSDFSGAVRWHYDLPLAYFLTGLVVYIYSFWATLRKMAENSRMSKLSSKDDECVFSWKLFTGWDFMIGHAETAHNRIASVVLGFKEALLEEAEKRKDTRNWKVIVLRIFVNFLVLCLLVVSASAVVFVVNRSTEEGANDSYWRRNEITVVITAISTFFPMFFEGLGFLESYHPRKQLRMQLARIMAMNLLNLYSLIFALFDKIGIMNKQMDTMRINTFTLDAMNASHLPENVTEFSTEPTMITDSAKFVITTMSNAVSELGKNTQSMWDTLISSATTLIPPHCRRIEVNCMKSNIFNKTSVTSWALLTTTILPEIWLRLNNSTSLDYYSGSGWNSESTTIDEWFNISTSLPPDLDFNSTVDFENFTNENLSTIFTTEFSDEYSHTDSTSPSKMHTSTEPSTTLKIEQELVETAIEVDEEYGQYEDYENELRRRKRDASNLFDQIQNYDWQFTEDLDNQTITNNNTNITEFLSSTISTFMDNFTMTPDEWNATSVGEMWTTYVSTIDENAWTDEDDTEPKLCYEIVCDPTDISSDLTDEDYSTFGIDERTEITTPQPTTPYPFTCPTMPFMPTTTMAPLNVSKKKITGKNLTAFIYHMDSATQMNLRKLCWETMFGQELVKLTVLDLVATITSVLFTDFFRALFVRFMNKCWCWDLEKKFPKYGDFKIAENILHLVNNQGQVWMGMFFSPGLAILNLVKLMILMYLRSWAVLTCNVPHEIVFRASRSNNFYLALLLTMLFLCVLPVGYAIVWIKPSWHCGPFSNHTRIHLVFTDTLRRILPSQLHKPLDYIASPSTVIPLLLLLVLIIYYLISLTNALREANEDLKNQLRRERQEERRKMLQRVVHAKLDDSGNGNNAMDRWRKVLEASSPLTPNAPGQMPEPVDEEKAQARKELLARIMKKALRKGSNTSEDESHDGGGDDETDTEQHESLPHDHQDVSPKVAPVRKEPPTKHLLDNKKSADSKHVRKPSFARMIIDAAKKADQAAKEQSKASKSPSPVKVEVARPQPAAKALAEDDGDEDLNEKVVSERRQLRRQQSIQDSIASGSLAKGDSLPTEKDETNYEIVNEKNKAVEKKAKQKIKAKIEPEIFKFDKEDIKKNTNIREKVDKNDANTKEMPTSTKNEKSSVLSNTSPSSKSQTSSDNMSQLPQQTAKPVKQHSNQRRHRERSIDRGTDISPTKNPEEPPKYATVIKPTAEVIQPKKSVADISSSKKFNASPTKDKSESESTSPIDKPINKLNSFLALVREAVQAKKQEQSPSPSPPPAPPPTVVSVRAIPDLPSRVKKYIDDSVSISEDGSTTKTTDSQSSQNVTRSSSKRKRHTAEQSKQLKRRDSQASIWSDNIPVITISKTESEECILEKSVDEAEDNLDEDIN